MRRDDSAWRRIRRDLGLLPALIMLAVGFHLLSGGRFLTVSTMTVLLHQVAVNLVLAGGMTVVVLAGGIDLSISSILAASAVMGLMASNRAGLSHVWALVPLAAGIGFGLANGLLIAVLHLPPFVLTLASSTVILGIARAVTGDMTIDNAHLHDASLGTGSLIGVPVPAMISMAVIVACWFVLRRTVLGTAIYTVGANPAAAHLSGIDVPRTRLIAYGVSGCLSGLAAIMVSSKLHGANAMQIGQSYTLDAITAVLLGGTSLGGGVGSIWGTAIGASLLVVLSIGLILTGVSDRWQAVVKGLVLIGAVALDGARLTGSARA